MAVKSQKEGNGEERIMYQFRTYGDLCHSKRFFERRDEIARHLAEVVKKTNEFRKSLDKRTKLMKGWEDKVSQREIWSSCELLKLDNEKRRDRERLIGQSADITNPLVEEK